MAMSEKRLFQINMAVTVTVTVTKKADNRMGMCGIDSKPREWPLVSRIATWACKPPTASPRYKTLMQTERIKENCRCLHEPRP